VRCVVNPHFLYAFRVVDDKKRKLFCAAVARLLREERERQGLSMTRLAERSGLSQQMISYVEREIRIPGLDTLLRMTDALGIEIDDLIRQARVFHKER